MAPVSAVFAGSFLSALLEERVTPGILNANFEQKDAMFSRSLRRKSGENRPGGAKNSVESADSEHDLLLSHVRRWFGKLHRRRAVARRC
jgi:hypothetical protein